MRLVLLMLIAAFLTFPAKARDKENHCDWKGGIAAERLAKSDAALYGLKDERTKAAVKKHLPFGKPKRVDGKRGKNEVILAGPFFVVRYDKDLRIPLWTAHHLTKAEKRRDSFRSDPRLDPDERSFCSDYEETVFDQGHMVSNADLDWIDTQAGYSLGMDHSFLMTNMTPQHCEFNRGPWVVLEDLSRQWAALAPDTWIVAGVIIDEDGVPGRDPDASVRRMKNHIGIESVAIPSHQYRIIIQKDGAGWKTLSFILPNDETMVTNAKRLEYLQDHIRTLDEISAMSGLRFLQGKTVTEGSALWPHGDKVQTVITSRC